MKPIRSIVLAVSLTALAGGFAYAADPATHEMNDMKGTHSSGCKATLEAPAPTKAKSHCGSTAKAENGHAHGAASAYSGAGTVKSVDKSAGKVSIAHGPIAPLQWPAMTMTFVVKDPKLLDGVASGQKVDFAFVQQGSQYVVTALR